MAVPWNFPALMFGGERIETQSPQSRGLTGFSPLLNDAEESWQQDVGSIRNLQKSNLLGKDSVISIRVSNETAMLPW